jgi:hypothetical protein
LTPGGFLPKYAALRGPKGLSDGPAGVSRPVVLLGRRFGAKPVGPASLNEAAADKGGRDPQATGHDPEKWSFRFSDKVMPKHIRGRE